METISVTSPILNSSTIVAQSSNPPAQQQLNDVDNNSIILEAKPNGIKEQDDEYSIDTICPLCIEQYDATDLEFQPCKCGYKMCVWCQQKVVEISNSKCPGCRNQFSINDNYIPKNKQKFEEELHKENLERKQKERESKKEHDLYRPSENIRIRNPTTLLILNLPTSFLDNEKLKTKFTIFGTITSLRIATATTKTSTLTPVYIDFNNEKAVQNAILKCDKTFVESNRIRCYEAHNRYCASFLQKKTCMRKNCRFVHQKIGPPLALLPGEKFSPTPKPSNTPKLNPQPLPQPNLNSKTQPSKPQTNDETLISTLRLQTNQETSSNLSKPKPKPKPKFNVEVEVDETKRLAKAQNLVQSFYVSSKNEECKIEVPHLNNNFVKSESENEKFKSQLQPQPQTQSKKCYQNRVPTSSLLMKDERRKNGDEFGLGLGLGLGLGPMRPPPGFQGEPPGFSEYVDAYIDEIEEKERSGDREMEKSDGDELVNEVKQTSSSPQNLDSLDNKSIVDEIYHFANIESDASSISTSVKDENVCVEKDKESHEHIEFLEPLDEDEPPELQEPLEHFESSKSFEDDLNSKNLRLEIQMEAKKILDVETRKLIESELKRVEMEKEDAKTEVKVVPEPINLPDKQELEDLEEEQQQNQHQELDKDQELELEQEQQVQQMKQQKQKQEEQEEEEEKKRLIEIQRVLDIEQLKLEYEREKQIQESERIKKIKLEQTQINELKTKIQRQRVDLETLSKKHNSLIEKLKILVSEFDQIDYFKFNDLEERFEVDEDDLVEVKVRTLEQLEIEFNTHQLSLNKKRLESLVQCDVVPLLVIKDRIEKLEVKIEGLAQLKEGEKFDRLEEKWKEKVEKERLRSCEIENQKSRLREELFLESTMAKLCTASSFVPSSMQPVNMQPVYGVGDYQFAAIDNNYNNSFHTNPTYQTPNYLSVDQPNFIQQAENINSSVSFNQFSNNIQPNFNLNNNLAVDKNPTINSNIFNNAADQSNFIQQTENINSSVPLNQFPNNVQPNFTLNTKLAVDKSPNNTNFFNNANFSATNNLLGNIVYPEQKSKRESQSQFQKNKISHFNNLKNNENFIKTRHKANKPSQKDKNRKLHEQIDQKYNQSPNFTHNKFNYDNYLPHLNIRRENENDDFNSEDYEDESPISTQFLSKRSYRPASSQRQKERERRIKETLKQKIRKKPFDQEESLKTKRLPFKSSYLEANNSENNENESDSDNYESYYRDRYIFNSKRSQCKYVTLRNCPNGQNCRYTHKSGRGFISKRTEISDSASGSGSEFESDRQYRSSRRIHNHRHRSKHRHHKYNLSTSSDESSDYGIKHKRRSNLSKIMKHLSLKLDQFSDEDDDYTDFNMTRNSSKLKPSVLRRKKLEIKAKKKTLKPLKSFKSFYDNELVKDTVKNENEYSKKSHRKLIHLNLNQKNFFDSSNIRNIKSSKTRNRPIDPEYDRNAYRMRVDEEGERFYERKVKSNIKQKLHNERLKEKERIEKEKIEREKEKNKIKVEAEAEEKIKEVEEKVKEDENSFKEEKDDICFLVDRIDEEKEVETKEKEANKTEKKGALNVISSDEDEAYDRFLESKPIF